MKKYNHTTYAILGILTTGCKSGYAIKQFIDQSLKHFWKISYGQVYPTLKRIVDEGLATVKTLPQAGKPDRKEYDLTQKGKETLNEWLSQPIEQLPSERNELLLKLFFGRHQSKETALTHLQSYLAQLQDRYQTYQDIEQIIAGGGDNQDDAMYWLFTLDYGKRMTQAAMEWCEATSKRLKEQEEK